MLHSTYKEELFCTLDCSQPYRCLFLAVQRSVENLAFIFHCRTFAYRTQAQGLTISLSAFSGLKSASSNPVIKADQCVRNADETDIARNLPEQLLKNLRTVLKDIQNAELKLPHANSDLGTEQVDCFG